MLGYVQVHVLRISLFIRGPRVTPPLSGPGLHNTRRSNGVSEDDSEVHRTTGFIVLSSVEVAQHYQLVHVVFGRFFKVSLRSVFFFCMPIFGQGVFFYCVLLLSVVVLLCCYVLIVFHCRCCFCCCCCLLLSAVVRHYTSKGVRYVLKQIEADTKHEKGDGRFLSRQTKRTHWVGGNCQTNNAQFRWETASFTNIFGRYLSLNEVLQTKMVCLRMYIGAYLHTYIHAYINAYIYTCKYTYTYVCMYVCMYVYMYVCMCQPRPNFLTVSASCDWIIVILWHVPWRHHSRWIQLRWTGAC